MSQVHRQFRCAPRLVPATVASLVSLFAIAPAETMLNRLLHAPQPVTAPAHGELAPQSEPHENPTMRLQRYTYKPEPPREESEQAACADGACFDPDGAAPAAGGVSGNEGGSDGPGLGPAIASEFELPSSPSQEAQFDTADLGAFADGGGGSGNGGASVAGGSGSGSGGDSGGGGSSFVLLPGAGGSGSESGQSGTGGDDDSQPQSSGEAGQSGAGGGGGGGGGSLPAGGPGEGDDAEEPLIETLSLRVAPPGGPIEVPAPSTAFLLAAALAVLGLRSRTM